MTLSIGDHVVKLGRDGKPIGPEGSEVHVEFEVEELLGHEWDGFETRVSVKLRKIR